MKYRLIGEKMIEASKLLENLYSNDNNIKLPTINYRVGSGNSTYYRRKQVIKDVFEHTITFGSKMIESKTHSDELNLWTCSKEILKYGFFNRNVTIQTSLTQTVLHEFAHFITTKKYGRTKGVSHGDDFYRELKSINSLYAEKIFYFLMTFEVFKNIEITEKLKCKTNALESKPNYRNNNIFNVGDHVYFMHKSKKVYGIIISRNQKTYSIDTQDSSFRVPKFMVNLSDNKDEMRACINSILQKNNAPNNFKKGQLISFKDRKGNTVKGKIHRVNQKTVTVNTEYVQYRVPFEIIL